MQVFKPSERLYQLHGKVCSIHFEVATVMTYRPFLQRPPEPGPD